MIQPIIVALSDKTWHPKFRSRKPYFFIGAVMCSLALFAFQKIKDADIPFIFFDKVPEEKNYNQVSINDAAVKSLNTLKINIPEAVSVLALSDGFLPKIYTPEISYIGTSGY